MSRLCFSRSASSWWRQGAERRVGGVAENATRAHVASTAPRGERLDAGKQLGRTRALFARPGVELGASLGAVLLHRVGAGRDGGELEAGAVRVEEVDRLHPAVVV